MSQDSLLLVLKGVFAIAAVAALIVFVVRPVLRILRQKPEMELLMPDFSNKLEEEELELPTTGDAPEFDRNTALKTVRSDPRATALMVQRWLKDRK